MRGGQALQFARLLDCRRFDNFYCQKVLPRCFLKILRYSIVRFGCLHIGNALRSQGADFPLAQTFLRLHTPSLRILLANAAGHLKYCKWTRITKPFLMVPHRPQQSNSLNGSALNFSTTQNKSSSCAKFSIADLSHQSRLPGCCLFWQQKDKIRYRLTKSEIIPFCGYIYGAKSNLERTPFTYPH